MNTNFISCLTWVSKGKAKTVPETVQLTEEDIRRMMDEAKSKVDKIKGNNDSEAMETNDEDVVNRYNLNDYEDDDEEEGKQIESLRMQNFASLTVHASNAVDPYLKDTETDSEDEEKESFEIKADDNLLIVGHVEGDACLLEVHVYNSKQDDFYPHHDVILEAYPLCLEWLSKPSAPNCVAVGDMTPDISIYNLDVVNLLEPVAKLSGHEDSVLSLAWDGDNSLLSGSADKHVFLWDIELSQKKMNIKKCKGNVQGVCLQPECKQVILVGDDKGNAHVLDGRSSSSKSWKFRGSEVETVMWDQLRCDNFFVATNEGLFVYCDSRMESSSVYTIKAHDAAVTGMAQSPVRKDCLATVSADKTVKIWNISSADKASFVVEHPKVKIGRILTISACPDEPFIFAVGGDSVSDNYQVLDVGKLKAVREAFT